MQVSHRSRRAKVAPADVPAIHPAVNGWEQTSLCIQLGKCAAEYRDLQDVRADLRRVMKRVEPVLVAGGTAPTDFTLHDAGHAFRVAELMVKVIPPETLPLLTHYELALLLLSAYLHDIGMVPEVSKERAVFDFVAFGEIKDVLPEEREALQRWLDENEDAGAVPLLKDQGTPERRALAEQLVAHYVRSRHNDWSGDWISRELSNFSMGRFNDWREDLIALCQSHHFGFDHLVASRFDSRLAGSPGVAVNLRYLAAALRIADIVEVDPERTPEVVYRHRLVAERSQIFWAKDHDISPHIEPERVLIDARPENARLHRAIIDMTDAIDTELAVCRRLADERKFQQGLDPSDRALQWTLPPAATRKIEPLNGQYVYIDGAFRPNTQKLLELLGSHRLYGDQPLVAVRELLQNGFDAVKEEIAAKRLKMPNPADRAWESKLGEQHEVRLSLEERGADPDKRWWVVCTDNGVGMTRRVIEEHVLVSGQARRREIESLARRCKEAGFRVARSGQFGIGVLAYFMLADRVEIHTRRSQAHGDEEATGWYFETEGVGSFGELRQTDYARQGSEVALRLRREIVGEDVSAFSGKLTRYVEETLARIPSRLTVQCADASTPALNCGPGWVRTHEGLAGFLLSHLEGDARPGIPVDLLSSASKAALDSERELLDAVRVEATRSVRWFAPDEGELPEGLGAYRISVPYFELDGCPSPAFMRVRRMRGIRNILPFLGRYDSSQRYGLVPNLSVLESRCGARVFAFGWKQSSKAIVEIDWEARDAGDITASRQQLAPTESMKSAIDWADRRAASIVGTRFSSMAGPFRSLTACLYPQPGVAKAFWIKRSSSGARGQVLWSPVKYPAGPKVGSLRHEGDIAARWRNGPVQLLDCLECVGARTVYWGPQTLSPSHIVVCRTWAGPAPVPLWTSAAKRPPHQLAWVSAFPPAWSKLVGASFEKLQTAWNEDHPLVRTVSEAAQAWIESAAVDISAMVSAELLAAAVAAPDRAAVWLGRLLDMQNRADVWNGLIEREPAIVSDLWGMIFGRALSQHDSMLILRGSLPHSFLSRVSLTGWETLSDKELLEQLPDPGPDWTLVIEHSERRATTGHSQSSRRTTKKPSRSIWSETLGTPSESQKGSSGGAKARRPRKAPASPAKATTPRVSPARTRSKPKPPPRKPRGK